MAISSAASVIPDVRKSDAMVSRSELLGIIASETDRAQRAGTCVNVILINIDQMNHINEVAGWSGGDQIIQQVGERVRKSVRSFDNVVRVGGDEFAVVWTGTVGERSPFALVERLQSRIITEQAKNPFVAAGAPVAVRTAMGVCVSQKQEKPEAIMGRVERALAEAKKNDIPVVFSDKELDVKLRLRREMRRDLAAAIDNDEIYLVYQPIYDGNGHDLVGVEALARWERDGVQISPMTFIKLAEETGLVVDLGTKVMRRAMLETLDWDGVSVAVNASAVQFMKKDFPKVVEDLIRETGFDAERLEIEITENVFVDDTEGVRTNIMALKDLGIRISLDDFGTGYSSLSYLRTLPLDGLKIDRSFLNDDAASELVQAITQIGHAYNLRVTAEGVETREHLEMVRDKLCDRQQGYHLARPQSLNDMQEMVRDAKAPAIRMSR